MSFNDRPRVALRFTADRAALASALDGLGAWGETALYDALSVAATSQREAPVAPAGDRRALRRGGHGERHGPERTLGIAAGAGVAGVRRRAQSRGGRLRRAVAVAAGSGGRYRDGCGSRASLAARIYEDHRRGAADAPTRSGTQHADAQTKDLEIDVVVTSAGTTARGWRTVGEPGDRRRGGAARWPVPGPASGRPQLARAARRSFFVLAVFVARDRARLRRRGRLSPDGARWIS